MNYRNIVTILVFITVWFVLFLIWNINKNSDTDNRYQVYNADGNTILLDKRTGNTWRNVWCDNKDKIPSCWELMLQNDEYINVPLGERLRRDEMIDRAREEYKQKKK